MIISICLATHERAFLLTPTLEAIARQTRLPDEIVISDSSRASDSEQVIAAFQRANPDLPIKYVKSECKALPWHRWNGFQHSNGEIVLFLDDDITLAPNALEMLEQAYVELFARFGVEQVAGVGFYTILDDGSEKLRRPASFEERWLGITMLPSATITPGGLGIPPKGMPKDSLVEVGRLSGGCMSFRRQALEQVGFLNNLVELFNQGIGPSEDTVLCHYAQLYGKLFMLTYPLVTHPNAQRAVHTVDAHNGWKKGLTETWGRAHTMRWMAIDSRMYRRDWWRMATLEVFRSIWWGLLRKPFSSNSWLRFAGGLYGISLACTRWKRIPLSAK
jgi:glycosyltransferase involved in cell wall biosynthesis